MSYTPPAANGVDFAFAGELAYTAPAATAINFEFTEPPVLARVVGVAAGGLPEAVATQQCAWVQCLPALGAPGAVAWQQFALASGVPALGPPQSLALVRPVAWVQGLPAAGDGQATAYIRPLAWLTANPAAGLPVTLAHSGFLALAQPLPALGLPQGTAARWGTLIQARPIAAVGTPRAQAWALPAAAAIIPPGVMLYYCLLTGAEAGLSDLILPISNFSVRHRPDAPSYYSITIPTYALITDLTARPDGQIVIWSEKSGVSEELMRGDLGQVSVYRGPNSQSITISGNADQVELEHRTYVLTDALFVASTFSGDTRLRIDPRAAIRPGDFVRYQDLNFEVGAVSWSVSVSVGSMAATMELANLPISA